MPYRYNVGDVDNDDGQQSITIDEEKNMVEILHGSIGFTAR